MYAAKTKVSVEKTKTEIESTLKRHGARKFAYFTDDSGACVMFEAHQRRIRFNLPIKSSASDQLHRVRWRALLLCIKAKLESVASNIETFEEAFLAHVVMDDNRTVYEHAGPRIAQMIGGGPMVPLLPPPETRS